MDGLLVGVRIESLSDDFLIKTFLKLKCVSCLSHSASRDVQNSIQRAAHDSLRLAKLINSLDLINSLLLNLI